MRWLLATFYLLTATWCNPLFAASLDLHLALAGYARSNAVIEMRIAPGSDSALLRASGATPNMAIDLPHRGTTDEPFTVPLFIQDAAQRLILTDVNGVNATGQNLLLHRVPTGHRFVVAVFAKSTSLDENSLSFDSDTFIQVTPNELPFLAISYAQIDGLMLDEASLSNLTVQQLGALEHYLAQCGPLAAHQVAAAVLTSLRNSAGCAGTAVTATAERNELRDWLAQIHPRHFIHVPPVASNAHAANTNLLQTYSGTLLGFFFVTCLFVVLFYRRVEGAMAVSLVSTLMLVFHWGASQHTMSLKSISTFAADATHGVLLGNVSTNGLFRDFFEFDLPSGAVVTATQGDIAHTTHRRENQFAVTMRAKTALNSHSETLFVSGIASPPLPTPFSEPARHGVRNSGAEHLRNAVFLIAGKAYAVPDLNPNQEWIFPESTAPTSLPLWIQRQIAPNEIGVVLPYRPALLEAMSKGIQSENWAIVKTAQAQ